ncbi:hypothetical protein CYG49_02150 [Candidatus Saccharibacteria bacterium]|nr:MAG: hypothetical protein CYG49_02150 [Candidatus Saccharibacteria bacterium]
MPLTFEQAVEIQPTYRPKDPEVLRALADISMAAFCGPTAVGKNYLMRLAGYPIVGTVTTRAPRPSDENYRYVSTSQLLGEIEGGRVVQFGTNPDAQTIYASDLQAYIPNSVNAMDVFTDSVDDLSELGYKAVKPIGVVATVNDWERRLDERFTDLSPHQIRSRLIEAERALRIISQWGGRPDKLLVLSRSELDDKNKGLILDFVQEGAHDNPQDDALQTIDDMLVTIPRFTKKYLKKDVIS